MNHTSKVMPWLRLFELFECQYVTLTGGLSDDFLHACIFSSVRN